MKGLPGSGKSTFTKQLVKDSGNAARINRDDLRAMLFDSVWTGKREGVVVEIEKAIAEILLKNKITPIIDDTNLLPKNEDMWRWFCNDYGIRNNEGLSIEINDIKTDINLCIDRDNIRKKPVGKAIINRMALDAEIINFGEKKLILVDIDGTIADGTHREHFLTAEKKNWNEYFRAMTDDEPIQHIIDWVNELSNEYTICIVSGRPDTFQNETLFWLRDCAKINFDYIFMRRGNDNRSDVEVKLDILAKIPKEQIMMVLDDRPAVINGCWRKNGIMVIPVCGECEDF